MSPISINEEKSATSSELNVEAKEFYPLSTNNHESGESSNAGVNSKGSGAVPKKFYEKRNNQPRSKKFYPDNQRNWRNNENRASYGSNEHRNYGSNEHRNYGRSNRRNDAEHKNNEEGREIKKNNEEKQERKFFKNNQHSYDRRGGNNGYTSKFKITIKPDNNKKPEQSDNGSKIESTSKSEEIPSTSNEGPNIQHKPKYNNDYKNHRKRPQTKRPVNKISISQREQLIKEIERNTLECMICCEKIKAYNPIWSCLVCYHILHLNCIKTWMKKSIESSEDGFRCPACNQIAKIKPGEYLCFCGKLKNPPLNRNDLPHSCGNMCLNTSNCDHPCNLVCHPGAHEKCYAVVNKFCGCGRTSKNYQCSMKATFECDSICEKVLNCGVHKCPKVCHQGDCEDCSEELECNCYCGTESKKILCTVENIDKTKYSCDNVCGKTLNCGNHKCAEKCHDGACKSCKLMPQYVKTCPCSRMSIKSETRKTCLDPVPLCDSVCKKALKCGPLSSPHLCASQCHLNECPPCGQTSNIKCRCGRKEEKVPCKDLLNTDMRCKKKCNKFKSCGRHKCNNVCCIDIDHTCMQNCNRMLDCQLHKCQRTCHIGNCAPCHRVSFDELSCECGQTIVYPPVHCGTVIKDCSNKCTRRHKCGHPVGHNCHSEPECPPCVFLTAKFCHGKHEERKTIPCNQDSFCCGMPCGKMLKCVRHYCIKTCHQGDCEKNDEICAQKCTKKRMECEHSCAAKCHDGECPDNIPCRERIQVTCQCGNLKSIKTCEQVEYENRKLQRVRLTAQQNDEASTLTEMLGDFKKTTKILDCNDECKTIERNRRLDIAFKVQNPTLATTPKFVPAYSEHVRNFYKKDSSFVNMVHDKLTELVKLAKETKNAAYRCYSFPSMNRDKRHVIHDVGEMFGVETKAFDAEPNRNIVATAVREYCWLPSMSVAEVIQRENGARRPPMNQLFK
ncbi:hypothetical protein ACKWTF_001359 [Chironomus riparius]